MKSPGFKALREYQKVNGPSHEKTNNLGFRPSPTQTRLYSHRRWLEPGNFRFEKKRNFTIPVAKTKVLISCVVTLQLIYVFVFAFESCLFSCAAAEIPMPIL